MLKAPEKTYKLRRSMVEHWDDERSLGHGWIVTLKDGWVWEPHEPGGLHVRGFDTKREAYDHPVYKEEA